VKWQWPPWTRHVDTTDEARATLEQLAQLDAEIHELSKQLKAVRRRNNFSIMVNEALARTREK